MSLEIISKYIIPNHTDVTGRHYPVGCCNTVLFQSKLIVLVDDREERVYAYCRQYGAREAIEKHSAKYQHITHPRRSHKHHRLSSVVCSLHTSAVTSHPSREQQRQHMQQQVPQEEEAEPWVGDGVLKAHSGKAVSATALGNYNTSLESGRVGFAPHDARGVENLNFQHRH
ncbi:hypothetical protein GWK47_054272 [Chionoecetes opilio]|uniref:Uncharacterized protein n=1 Tax=Chionoecetes opilio TaxID=41210 RepID=A0A8J5CQ31_CHIOP|nr:hypothetical protein GWK47_054272 [Chionoecetes opilio]